MIVFYFFIIRGVVGIVKIIGWLFVGIVGDDEVGESCIVDCIYWYCKGERFSFCGSIIKCVLFEIVDYFFVGIESFVLVEVDLGRDVGIIVIS